jgi:hypothetical protein
MDAILSKKDRANVTLSSVDGFVYFSNLAIDAKIMGSNALKIEIMVAVGARTPFYADISLLESTTDLLDKDEKIDKENVWAAKH